MISLKDLSFISNDQNDYVRRLERAYEVLSKELERERAYKEQYYKLWENSVYELKQLKSE